MAVCLIIDNFTWDDSLYNQLQLLINKTTLFLDNECTRPNIYGQIILITDEDPVYWYKPKLDLKTQMLIGDNGFVREDVNDNNIELLKSMNNIDLLKKMKTEEIKKERREMNINIKKYKMLMEKLDLFNCNDLNNDDEIRKWLEDKLNNN